MTVSWKHRNASLSITNVPAGTQLRAFSPPRNSRVVLAHTTLTPCSRGWAESGTPKETESGAQVSFVAERTLRLWVPDTVLLSDSPHSIVTTIPMTHLPGTVLKLNVSIPALETDLPSPRYVHEEARLLFYDGILEACRFKCELEYGCDPSTACKEVFGRKVRAAYGGHSSYFHPSDMCPMGQSQVGEYGVLCPMIGSAHFPTHFRTRLPQSLAPFCESYR